MTRSVLLVTPLWTRDGGVGTHGYREVGGSICQPVGQNGAVSISVDETQGNWGYRR